MLMRSRPRTAAGEVTLENSVEFDLDKPAESNVLFAHPAFIWHPHLPRFLGSPKTSYILGVGAEKLAEYQALCSQRGEGRHSSDELTERGGETSVPSACVLSAVARQAAIGSVPLLGEIHGSRLVLRLCTAEASRGT